MSDRLAALVVALREDADRYERDAAQVDGAKLCRRIATDLEAALREHDLEPLSLSVAAQEAGVTYDTMSRRVRRGAVPNVGRKGAPRVRRRDLRGVTQLRDT